MHHLIESRRAEIRALAERHGFQQVRVFGSMVRDDAHERSDVDLLVTLLSRLGAPGWRSGRS